MAWRQLRTRAIRPVFGDHFLLIREIGADPNEILSLLHKSRRAEERGAELGDL